MRRGKRPAGVPVRVPAPVKGLVENLPAVTGDPLGAEWLEGFVPTERGIRVRGGIRRAAYVDGAVKSLHRFVEAGNNKFFAATSSALYDISDLNPVHQAAPASSGLTSGDWTAQQIGTSGGDFLIFVNGSDYAHLFDGSDLNPQADQPISNLSYDGCTSDFSPGETVAGAISGATALVVGVVTSGSTSGTLKLGTVTGGPFQDNEAISSAGGAAIVDGVVSSASAITISGVSTRNLSHAWVYQNRLFFIEKNTLRAWYLPTASIGGTALDLSLAGVFQKGGSLLFGATWALDSGSGLDDKCVFVSTEGEVAIYSGSDPSNASSWSLQGRYDIGKPIGKRAVMRAGGDLLIATDDGIVPLSEALQRDPAALSLAAVTSRIRDTWDKTVLDYGRDVEILKWTQNNLMLVQFPGSERMLTANLLTGAWATQGGWRGNCMGEYDGAVFVGRDDGRIYQIDDTGEDDGVDIVAQACMSFSDFGNPTSFKRASLAKVAFNAYGDFAYSVSISEDYRVQFPSAPDPLPDQTDQLVWGFGNWGNKVWKRKGANPRQGRVDLWRAVSGAGHVMAPVLQVTSSGFEKLDAEILAIDIVVVGGGRVS